MSSSITQLPPAAFLHVAEGEKKEMRRSGTCALSKHRDLMAPWGLRDV